MDTGENSTVGEGRIHMAFGLQKSQQRSIDWKRGETEAPADACQRRQLPFGAERQRDEAANDGERENHVVGRRASNCTRVRHRE